MKKICNLISVGVLFIAVGCSLGVRTEENQISVSNDPSIIAKEYVQKMISFDELTSSRSASNDYDYPDLIYMLEIEDEDGNPILFEDMSDAEKVAFYSYWQEQTVQELTEKFEDDADLAKMISLENAAFAETMEESGRSAIKSGDYGKFAKKYEKNLANFIEQECKADGNRAAAHASEITKDCLVATSVEIFKNNYKKGNILICKDTSSSSASSFIGHASMMYADGWNPEWEKNGLARTTVTSSPIAKSAQWDGKIDGVQYEPLGYWAGNSDGSAAKVSIQEIKGKKWVWNWFKSGYRYYKPTDSERNSAVNYAENQLGKEYHWFFLNKWYTKEFYCSQLVWRSWYEVDHNYDSSLGPLILFVSPGDIASKTDTIATIQNK